MKLVGRVRTVVKQHKSLDFRFDLESVLRVGFIDGRTDPDVMVRAYVNEYGAVAGKVVIPPRPFMRQTMVMNRQKYKNFMTKAARRMVLGYTTTEEELKQLGIIAAQDIEKRIEDLKTPPNAPRTIRLKGSSNPLIDTGEMQDSVLWEVK